MLTYHSLLDIKTIQNPSKKIKEKNKQPQITCLLCYIGLIYIQLHDADREVVDEFDDALHCVSQAFLAGGLPAQGKEKGES